MKVALLLALALFGFAAVFWPPAGSRIIDRKHDS